MFLALIRWYAKTPEHGNLRTFFRGSLELLLSDPTLQPKSKGLESPVLVPDKNRHLGVRNVSERSLEPPLTSSASIRGEQGVRQRAGLSVGLQARCSFYCEAKFTCQKARTFSDCLQKMSESSA
jgi:hypothetical protein